MSDLISRKALEIAIRAYADDVGCNRGEYELANGILKSLSIVSKLPTAFDVDEVVEKIKTLQGVDCPDGEFGCGESRSCEDCKVEKCIDILKGAVKGE